MRTIINDNTNEIIIKNSRFINLLIKINNPNIDSIITKIKEKYPKATHYCYAYIYNDIKRFSDDAEPTGTAGMPLLNVLEKENLNNILTVTVRYFGGIKLGAGGLVRAYTKSLTENLKNTELCELEDGYKIEINFNYNDEKQINYLLNDSIILEKYYDESIKYISLVKDDILTKLHNYNVTILEKIFIEKKN